MKIALVHEFLTQYGGAERILNCFLEMWPRADVYTLVYNKDSVGEYFDNYNIKTSFIQKFPAPPPARYKWWLALYPKAIESFDLSSYDLVISDSSAFSKGVITKKPTIHISYIHTPTRYLWSVTKEYLKEAPIPALIRPIMPPFIKALRNWDFKAAQRPDYIIANSQNVSTRIKKFYKRTADAVIWPFVDSKKFFISNQEKKYWLVAGRHEPYKKTQLVIQTANKLDLPLVVSGGGSKINKLKKIAGPKIKFTGRVNDEELARLYSNCIGFIFPPEEDAGMMPLEAMASGRPVIAYGRGGVLESVVAGIAGEFFYTQTEDDLAKVIKNFKISKYDPQKIRAHAKKFDKTIFQRKIGEFITKHTVNLH